MGQSEGDGRMAKYNSLKDVPPHLLEAVGRYISNVHGSTFTITGLPPELTGALLARYSRSPTSLKLTLINEFLDDQGQPSQKRGTDLINRVLNAFGDDSVGELEGAHMGIEDISQLLTKEIEDRRIGGSPIEQSTRYVKYDVKDDDGRWRYLRPQEVVDAGLLAKFERVNDRAFEVYSDAIKKLTPHFQGIYTREKHKITVDRNGEKVEVYEKDLASDTERREFNNSYAATIRGAACDVGRALLPSSTLTHMGIFGNGRFYTHLLNHLKSSDIKEPQQRALDIEIELNKTIPTYIKRNRRNEKISQNIRAMRELVRPMFQDMIPETKSVTLLERGNLLDETVTYCIFPFVEVSAEQIYNEVRQMPPSLKDRILDTYKGTRDSRRDRNGRGLEAGYPLFFDLVGGFAEYRDLERHRILTQQRQMLSTLHGFIIPEEFAVVGIEKNTLEVIDMMADLNSDMRHAGLEDASQYATLFNHRIRFAMGMNLREFQHLGELRTQPAGHPSYRAMTMDMARAIIAREPWSERFIGFVNYEDPGNKIARAKEQSKIAGKNLESDIDGASILE